MPSKPKPKRRILELAGMGSPFSQRLKEKANRGQLPPTLYLRTDLPENRTKLQWVIKNTMLRPEKVTRKGNLKELYYHLDATRFPYRLPNGREIPNNSLDEIHLHMPLGHFIELPIFLDEINRILKDKGRAYFTLDSAGLTGDLYQHDDIKAIADDPRFRVRILWTDMKYYQLEEENGKPIFRLKKEDYRAQKELKRYPHGIISKLTRFGNSAMVLLVIQKRK